MKIIQDDSNELVDFLNSYNECFLQKNIEKLKNFYDDELIYFDNHKNNDTYNLDEHLKLLSDFFKNGKKTESGHVEPITVENLNIFQKDKTACLIFISRYKSFSNIPIRSTLYLEKIDNWKIKHAHYSFQPEK